MIVDHKMCLAAEESNNLAVARCIVQQVKRAQSDRDEQSTLAKQNFHFYGDGIIELIGTDKCITTLHAPKERVVLLGQCSNLTDRWTIIPQRHPQQGGHSMLSVNKRPDGI